MKKILIVEDDQDIANLISETLLAQGFKPYVVNSLAQAYSFLLQSSVDLVVLDLILPDGDGIELLKYLKFTSKFSKTPVVIVSARGAELDRVLGLELGADDYVVKPFSLRELTLRIKKLLKNEGFSSSQVKVGPLLLDKEKKTISLEEKPLILTPTEYKILELLIENPEKVFSREELSSHLWALEKDYYSRVVDAYICRLRDKLGDYGYLIETVRGFGYKLKKNS
ncbi:response regulator transcription factor [Thermodesulfobacterium sp. TA1]|uniref:response regulator transcription factor n=1 Tax=Thermodesulfobacterium sp. TA1 TaxID=2234087 RepID=UPI001231DEEE|nr:response regulator transcription factor [Thermodesulfobacterium sp. TA1]QER42564.1 response regulator transcription factor [Thermodesulfobacterium sp. TA1]